MPAELKRDFLFEGCGISLWSVWKKQTYNKINFTKTQMWLRCQEVGNVAKDGWRTTQSAPLLLFLAGMESARFLQTWWKERKQMCVKEKKKPLIIINCSGSITQTWCCVSALSEWEHGIHESLSQKLWIRCFSFNLLETFGGVLEEKVVSIFGLEQSEYGIIFIVSELGLDRKSKINESEPHLKPSLGIFWRYGFLVCFVRILMVCKVLIIRLDSNCQH